MPKSPATSEIAVPPLNLAANFQPLRAEILREITEICDSGFYVLGPKVQTFEQAFAEYCGAKHCLGVSSGTDALLVAMMALGIGPGDEVIVPAYSFFATAGCVARLGATPVFCDIDPRTFNIDPDQIAGRLTPRTRAIIPVHLYGQLADMDRINAVARERELPVIEDAAQAVGARMSASRPRRAGALSHLGCISFYPTKNLGAIGDAGALLTDDDRLLELARKLRIHGSGHTYYHELVGGNFRIDALQAAILHIKLRMLDEWNAARRARTKHYTQLLTQAGLSEFVAPPVTAIGEHVYHQYVLRVPQRRDDLLQHLRERKIGAGVYYPVPLHLQQCFAGLAHQPGDFPQSERAAAEVLALPIYPELTDRQQTYVVESIAAFFRT